MKPASKTFSQLLYEAIREFSANGSDQFLLTKWQGILRDKILSDLPPTGTTQTKLRDMLTALYRRKVENGEILKYHPGISRMTLSSIAPSMRAELSRRMSASADLIKLNREQSIEKTLQRFAGWSSSVPPGGSKAIDARDVKDHISKPLRSMSYEERRLYIDQGHKMVSNISAILAEQSGAIAGMWRSHWRQAGYDYREDHKERDKKVYTLRGNWAIKQGLMNKGEGYTDEMTAAGFEPNCRCNIVYLHSLRDLPEEMLTEKGKKALAQKKASGI